MWLADFISENAELFHQSWQANNLAVLDYATQGPIVSFLNNSGIILIWHMCREVMVREGNDHSWTEYTLC